MAFRTNILSSWATKYAVSLWLGSLLLICALINARGQITDKTDFNCEKGFQSVIQTNDVLLVAGVDVTKASNGKTYLLAIGIAINQAKGTPGAKAAMDTRKVAESKARKQATEFLQTDIHTETKLMEIKNSEKVSTNDGLKKQITEIITMREEIIVLHSQAILGGSKVVATWLSDDKSLFNAVVAVELKGQNKE